jgi:hypothetical protein
MATILRKSLQNDLMPQLPKKQRENGLLIILTMTLNNVTAILDKESIIPYFQPVVFLMQTH